MAAHQAPPSLGFSRQEYWNGLPFPSPMRESEKWKWSRSVMSYSSRPHGLQPTRLLCPWDFPYKSAGVACYCLYLLIFSTFAIFCSMLSFWLDDKYRAMPKTGSGTSVFIKLLLKKSGGYSLYHVIRVAQVVWAGWEVKISSVPVGITHAKPTLNHCS